MTAVSSTSLADALRQYRLLDSDQLQHLSNLQTGFPDPNALVGELLRRGWLTAYQANLLLQGCGEELLLGSYVLLERLGAGGMGQVFKAKNWKLGRIVALKLIRKERLANEDAVRRFEREIRAAAQLSHPNIVLAYDADRVHGTHFFAMEYVDGTDLARLLKQHGPVSAAQACDWIRQAALGLQHAHERGLVHRDIKPHNLLLTKQGVVKILDMGLARVMASEDGEASTTMTQEGAVMGTPDYMAPEQAEESHGVDIRADLYSLGCTLYQLLTGKVPFPGGTLIQKLKKHQFEQPVPIEERRRDVPPDVAAVVRKLMAKHPEDRYATPADLVRALEALTTEDGRTLPNGAQVEGGIVPTEPTVNDALDFRLSNETVQTRKAEQRWQRQADRRKVLLAALGGSVLLVGLSVALWIMARPSARPPGETLPVTAEKPRPAQRKTPLFDQWLREVADLPPEKQVEAVVKKLQERNPGYDGTEKHEIEGGAVTILELRSNELADVSPVRALRGLKNFTIRGVPPGRATFADLKQLKGMPLSVLRFPYTSVRDLSPLQQMPLVSLSCGGSDITDLSPLRRMRLTELDFPHTSIRDLSPLEGMPLVSLFCNRTGVTDLSPLRGMRLTTLYCNDTKVADLSPLQGMPLARLNCDNTLVTDLSVVKGMPLREVSCNFWPERDAAILRSIKTLGKINGKPAAEFWKEVEAKKP